MDSTKILPIVCGDEDHRHVNLILRCFLLIDAATKQIEKKNHIILFSFDLLRIQIDRRYVIRE